MRRSLTLTQKLLVLIAALLSATVALEVVRILDVRRSAAFGNGWWLPQPADAASGRMPSPSSSRAVSSDANARLRLEWNPFDRMQRVQQEIDRVFQAAFLFNPLGRPAPGVRAAEEGAEPSFETVLEMRRQIEAIFQRAFQDLDHFGHRLPYDEAWNAMAATPALDLQEDGGHYLVTVSLPGLDKSDIDVTIEGRLLTIHTHRAPAASPPSRNTSLEKEIVLPGRFERRLYLPGAVSDAREVEATYARDTLRIVVPKADPKEVLEKRIVIR